MLYEYNVLSSKPNESFGGGRALARRSDSDVEEGPAADTDADDSGSTIANVRELSQ